MRTCSPAIKGGVCSSYVKVLKEKVGTAQGVQPEKNHSGNGGGGGGEREKKSPGRGRCCLKI